jgi:hypothetical protein
MHRQSYRKVENDIDYSTPIINLLYRIDVPGWFELDMEQNKMSKIYLSLNGTFEVNGQTVWKETEYGLCFFP